MPEQLKLFDTAFTQAPVWGIRTYPDERVYVVCAHGVEHPAYLLTPPALHAQLDPHVCDGCCAVPEGPWEQSKVQALQQHHVDLQRQQVYREREKRGFV